MTKAIAVAAVVCGLTVIPLSAQTRKAAPKGTTYDVTINADGAAHTGTMQLAVAAGKVSGEMHIKNPSEITGKAAGVTKAGQMLLDFPYRMVQRACDGRIVMDIKLPAKPAATEAWPSRRAPS